MFRLIPHAERFFDLFEEQGRNIVAATGRLREMYGRSAASARRPPGR